jgi:protein TonB
LIVDAAVESFSPRKLAGIAFVALLHVAILYALINGLGVRAVQIFQHPLDVKIIQPVKPPRVAPPPPPPPLLAPPPPFIPPPLVQIAQPPPPVPVIATVTQVKPVAPPPVPRPAPVPVPVRSGAMLDPNQSCAPPQYPEAAEDMEQTGISVLQFLIDTNGNVLQSRIASSSGHASLDDAAEEALGQCKFRPAIGADGKPQEAWTSIRYVWQLN